MYKTIDTVFKRADGSVIPGHRQSFSSYPGSVFSGDDYYTLSSGLTVCETTIGTPTRRATSAQVRPPGGATLTPPPPLPGTYNKTSLEFITYNTVYESARNTVANRLASSGQEWSQLFGEHNNGCYCNQFYVTDYNKFTPGQRPMPGTLWVLEQVCACPWACVCVCVCACGDGLGSPTAPSSVSSTCSSLATCKLVT